MLLICFFSMIICTMFIFALKNRWALYRSVPRQIKWVSPSYFIYFQNLDLKVQSKTPFHNSGFILPFCTFHGSEVISLFFSLQLSMFYIFYFIFHLLNSLNTIFFKSRAENKRLHYRGMREYWKLFLNDLLL